MSNNFGKESWALKKIFESILKDPEFLDCHRSTGVFVGKLSEAIDYSIDKNIEIRVFGLPTSGMIAHSEIFIDGKRVRNKYIDQSYNLENYHHLFSLNANAIAAFTKFAGLLDTNKINGFQKVLDEFDDLIISHKLGGSTGYFKNEKKDFLESAVNLGFLSKASEDTTMNRFVITEKGIDSYLDFLIFYGTSGCISKFEIDKRFSIVEGLGMPENTISPRSVSQINWVNTNREIVKSYLISGRDADSMNVSQWNLEKNRILTKDKEQDFNNQFQV